LLFQTWSVILFLRRYHMGSIFSWNGAVAAYLNATALNNHGA
jgi:hypothetical protein